MSSHNAFGSHKRKGDTIPLLNRNKEIPLVLHLYHLDLHALFLILSGFPMKNPTASGDKGAGKHVKIPMLTLCSNL